MSSLLGSRVVDFVASVRVNGLSASDAVHMAEQAARDIDFRQAGEPFEPGDGLHASPDEHLDHPERLHEGAYATIALGAYEVTVVRRAWVDPSSGRENDYDITATGVRRDGECEPGLRGSAACQAAIEATRQAGRLASGNSHRSRRHS